MKKTLCPVILVLVLFASCKSKPKIDKEKAVQLIVKDLNLPLVNYGIFKSGNNDLGTGYNWQEGYIDPTPILRNRLYFSGEIYLLESGYRSITASIEPILAGPNSHHLPENLVVASGPMILKFLFTEKAKPYLKNDSENLNIWNNFNGTGQVLLKLKTNEISFGNLTSLRQINENEYEVEFSLNVENTPFAEAIKQGEAWYKSGKFINSSQYQNLKVKILKYEDGWKVATDDLSELQKRLM